MRDLKIFPYSYNVHTVNGLSRVFSLSSDNYFKEYECQEIILPPVRHRAFIKWFALKKHS